MMAKQIVNDDDMHGSLERWRNYPPSPDKAKRSKCLFCEREFTVPCDAASYQGCGNYHRYKQERQHA